MDKAKDARPPSIHEGLVVSVLLSVVGGYLDAYTYLLMGGVFANAQTGNVVLLAVALLELPTLTFLKFLFPILAFVVGVVIAEGVRQVPLLQVRFRGVLVVVVLELVVLGALGVFARALSPWTVTVVVSLVAGVQASSFKKVKQSPYATTMVTGNIRSVTELVVQFFTSHDRKALAQARTYLVIVAAFVAGACAGALASLRYGTPAIFACCGLMAVVAILIAVTSFSSVPKASDTV
jgi:uncharacterized membrane protein YoaK (UPF0700 family)